MKTLSPILLALALAAGAGALAQAQDQDFEMPPEEADFIDEDAPPPAPPVDTGEFAPAVNDAFAPPADLEDPIDDFSSVIEGERVVLRALNKVTATTQDFTVNFGEPLQYGSLTVLARYCSRRPPEMIPETFVFLEIFDRTFVTAEADDEYGQKIFGGWMLGSSPGLHGLEHSVYDIWPVGCQVPGDEALAAEAAMASEDGAAAAARDDEAADDQVFTD